MTTHIPKKTLRNARIVSAISTGKGKNMKHKSIKRKSSKRKNPRKNPPANSQVFVGRPDAPAHGEWIDLDSIYDVEDLSAAIVSVVGKGRGWIFSDYSDFPSLGEHPDLEKIIELKGLVDEHGIAPTAAAFELAYGDDVVDETKELLENGFYVVGSPEEYVEEYMDLESWPIEQLLRYIDTKALARAVLMDHPTVRVDNDLYIFQPV